MKSFYNGPHIIKKIVYDLKFVIEDQKSKKQQKVHYDRLNVFRERTKINAQDKNKRGRKEKLCQKQGNRRNRGTRKRF